MPRDLRTILKLRVPVIVRIGHRRMSLSEVLALTPGAVIELPQCADAPVDLMVNNKVIGQGVAVKIDDRLGLRLTRIGDSAQRIHAMAADASSRCDPGPSCR